MLFNSLSRKIWHFLTAFVYRPFFSHIGKRSIIRKPVQLDETKSIFIDDNVYISEYAWLMGSESESITLTIGAGSTIGHFAHIIAKKHITIEKNVMIADRVFITDCTHYFEDINTPIMFQGISHLNDVNIGEGSWVGENVCICGCNIGTHCVIGANSVVLQDVPDYSVAVGSPARVVKKYDHEKKQWVRIYNNE